MWSFSLVVGRKCCVLCDVQPSNGEYRAFDALDLSAGLKIVHNGCWAMNFYYTI